MEIALIDRMIGVLGHLVRRLLESAPEVRDESIGVVDRLGALRAARAGQETRAGAEERLDDVGHAAEALPDQRRDARLAAEVGERRVKCHGVTSPKSDRCRRMASRSFASGVVPDCIARSTSRAT